MFNRENVTVTKLTKTLTDGKYTQTTANRTITASVQDYEPDETLLLEFGDRIKKAVLIVSKSEVKVDELLTWRDETFRIMKASNYSNIGLIKSAQYQALGVIV